MSKPQHSGPNLFAATQDLLTRRRFLALLGVAGLGAYTGVRAGSVPDNFYERSEESPLPAFDPRTYRLVVDGLVSRPLSFTYRRLLWLPSSRQRCSFLCIEGWGVDDVPWEGVKLGTLMMLARPLEEGRFVTFHCLGGVYQESLSLEEAELPNALLAYRMYGSPLLPEHGSPLRLVFPGMLGYKSAKWVTRVEFRSERDLGYWEKFGAKVDPWLGDEQPCSACGPGSGHWRGSGTWFDRTGRRVTPTPTPATLQPGGEP